jgi:hypothetical protein
LFKKQSQLCTFFSFLGEGEGGGRDWGLSSGLHAYKTGHSTTWPHLQSILLWYFGDGVLKNICPNWPQITILSISASQIARITSVSH